MFIRESVAFSPLTRELERCERGWIVAIEYFFPYIHSAFHVPMESILTTCPAHCSHGLRESVSEEKTK